MTEPTTIPYVAHLAVGDVRLDNLDRLTAYLAEYAHVGPLPISQQTTEAGPIPLAILITYDVGPGGAADDLWNLRDVVECQNDHISEWTENRISKPVPRHSAEGRAIAVGPLGVRHGTDGTS